MKEPITKFDLETAFKALDEIDIPVADTVIANKPALTEIFSRKSKFDTLIEEYYDVGNVEELDSAKETREAEVAQAKLARIEKIVDLDAESPEDLLPSYVGKFIIQCPQCMTLFYKNPEDVEASEEDPNTVNVSEVCQHCGNEAGYTLIGKVGEATEEETAEFNQEETVDVTSTEENEEEFEITDDLDGEPTEDDLNVELDELDLDIEDDTEEKTEESFNAGTGETLVEELTEEKELDISADEFEKLINSPEFKKPISDTEARAMMDEAEGEKEEVKEGFVDYEDDDDFLTHRIDDMMYRGRFLYASWIKDAPTVEDLGNNTYKVTHYKGGTSVTVKFDTSNIQDPTLRFTVDGKEFATKYVNEAQDFVIQELEAARVKSFDVSVESCSVDNASKNCESLEEGIFDKLRDTLKSREGKADWLLANTLNDYDNIELDADGKIVPNESNQKFKTFAIIGYASRDNKGDLIKAAPDFDDKNLVIGKDGVKYVTSYKEADKIAKAWSEKTGNGPAFIYFAADENDDNAAFICEYFMGSLKNDQLDKYFKAVKEDIKNATNTSANEDTTEDTTDESATNESLANLMDNVDDLQEAALEKVISDSLIESYGNVAGFRLTECAYEANKFIVDGTIFFTSGNKRKTSYVFAEALATEGKVNIQGINEKLGLDKKFTITGYTNNRTFITESFKTTKN